MRFTKNRHLMREKLPQYFEKCTPEINLIIDLICGLCESRKTSSTALSMCVTGGAKVASKQRRIERFLKKGLDDEQALWDAIGKIFSNRKVVLSFDRTNWQYGSTHVNALIAFASDGNIGSIVNIKMLNNKGGNSKSVDRIELAKHVIDRYGKENIKSILGDREFFSVEFAIWLIENDIPFVIRLRENLDFVQPYLGRATKHGKVIRNVVVTEVCGTKVMCDLSIKIIDNEYLILASYKIKSPLSEYKKRWGIERFFKMLKTGGFNIEDTKITDPARLKILFMLCSFAYLICTVIGHYRCYKVEKIRWKKKDRCYEYSFFRWGLDWLKELVFQGADIIKHALAQIIPTLQP